jgi:hypothetical protein
LGSQEVSKPVLITVLAVVAIALAAMGWWYFGRTEKYPGYQAPTGGYGRRGGTVPGMGMETQRQGPGGAPPAGAMPRGGSPR